MTKKLALFLFAMGVSASAAWALPGPVGSCEWNCWHNYQICSNWGGGDCLAKKAECLETCLE